MTSKSLTSGHSLRPDRNIIISGVRHFNSSAPYKPRDMNSRVIRLNKLIKDVPGKEDWLQKKQSSSLVSVSGSPRLRIQ